MRFGDVEPPPAGDAGAGVQQACFAFHSRTAAERVVNEPVEGVNSRWHADALGFLAVPDDDDFDAVAREGLLARQDRTDRPGSPRWSPTGTMTDTSGPGGIRQKPVVMRSLFAHENEYRPRRTSDLRRAERDALFLQDYRKPPNPRR